MRNAALTELLDTETKYFTLLKTLVYSFLDVLRQVRSRHLVCQLTPVLDLARRL